MPLYLYQIADGYDNIAGLANIETIFSYAPRGARLPLGAITRVGLSGNQRTDGEQIVTWHWDVAKFDEVDDFITTYLGASWNTENAEVTIATRYRDNLFSGQGSKDYLNALLYLPLEYRHHPTTHIRDLDIRFRIVGDAT